MGVTDSNDECRYTPSGLEVNSVGCSGVQLDDDGDGVHNLNDLCPSTTPGNKVSSTGCAEETQDEANPENEEETSYMIWVLFSIAGILVIVAAYVTFKPQTTSPKNQSRSKCRFRINCRRWREPRGSSAASADVSDSSLNLDTSES